MQTLGVPSQKAVQARPLECGKVGRRDVEATQGGYF